MKIYISDLNYHIGELNKDEKRYLSNVLGMLKQKTGFSHKNIEKELILKILCAILMEKKATFEKLDEKSFYTEIYETLNPIIPVILDNNKVLNSNHFSLYEPTIALIFNQVNEMMDKVNEIIGTYDEYNTQYVLLCNNILRSIKAIITLISIGDDVHGMSVGRGLIEQVAKLEFLSHNDCKDNFILFNKVNCEIQYYKSNNKYKMNDFSVEFLKEKNLKLSSTATENYLLYQWMSNDKITIKNGTQLVEYIFESKEILKVYHMTSEFVHEDYIMTGYNWFEIRRWLTYLVCYSFQIVYEHINL